MTTALSPRRPGEPAPDLSDYTIVHRAMTTDLRRLSELVDRVAQKNERLDGRRAAALREYLVGITAEIRSHHQVEDDHVWPLLVAVAADPPAGLADLTGDHGELDPLLSTAGELAGRLAEDPDDQRLAAALGTVLTELSRVLIRHVADEERVVFPLIREYVRVADYRRLQRRFRGSLSLHALRFVVPWVVSHATAAEGVALRGEAGLAAPGAAAGCRLTVRRPTAAGVGMTPVTGAAPPTPAALFGPAGPGERYAAYAALAATGPAHRIELPDRTRAWLVTGHNAVRSALADPSLTKDLGPAPDDGLLPPEIDAAMNSDLLHRDAPDHTRLRRLVSAAFTRRRVDALAPRIQQITDALLDDLAERSTADLITTFAYPLPITVISELLGVPVAAQAGFREWSTTLVGGSAQGERAWVAAAMALVGYVRGLVVAKRASPADDLMSALVAARDGTDRLTENELTSMVFLLLVAGHETTVNLIGNGMHTLLTHPGQLALLRAEPERLPAAIEEMLRFAGPVQIATFRRTTTAVRIGDTVIPAGELVIPGLLAANRDPARIAYPDSFDPTRADSPHLAFGHGLHHCIGAPLARLETRIALGSLLARFPDLSLAVPAEDLRWRPSLLMHGLAALPVRLNPR